MLTLIVLAVALQQVPAPTVGTTPPVAPAPATTPAPAPRRPAPAGPTTVDLRVTDRSGKPAPFAHVIAEGPSSRDGVADAAGLITFRSLTAGTYRVRAEAEGFIALEKEVTVRGAMPAVEFALSAAPSAPRPESAPPAPTAPAPVALAPVVRPGEPRIVSLLDVAENSLGGKDAVRTVPVGCSGVSRSQLLVVRDTLAGDARPDADDMLYVIAGEASITLAGKTQNITSGWFSIVPRGTSRTVVRRGKNPLILLSMVSGPSCEP